LSVGGGSGESGAPPTRAELERLQDRIGEQWHSGQLAREGIYLMTTGHPGKRCVSIGLLNPTRPNAEYLRHRFGPDVCVKREPVGPIAACAEYLGRPVRSGGVRVPDLRGLGLYAAERKVTARRLTYSIWCSGDKFARPKQPAPHSPDRLVRVVAQCPRAGERVSPGTDVALDAVALLPGGFRYRTGTLSPYHTGTSTPCGDRRNPSAGAD
jgi:hypothetical protein